VFNTVMNFRQFLLRGLEKVQTELTWMCTAYNLRKMVMLLSAAKAASAG